MIGQKRIDVNSNYDFTEWQINQDDKIKENVTNISKNTNDINVINDKINNLKLDVDMDFSNVSENAIANKTVSNKFNNVDENILNDKALINTSINSINSLWLALNSLSGGSTITNNVLFDNSLYSNYFEAIDIKNSQWDNNYYNLSECITDKNINSVCSENFDYSFRLSNDFGWHADLDIIFLTPINFNNTSILNIIYWCSTNDEDIIVTLIDNLTDKNTLITFDSIMSINMDNNAKLQALFSQKNTSSENIGYLRFNVRTANPIFQFYKIAISTTN